jgi:hypothetical protein
MDGLFFTHFLSSLIRMIFNQFWPDLQPWSWGGAPSFDVSGFQLDIFAGFIFED